MTDTTRNLQIETAIARRILAALDDVLDGDEQAQADTVEGETDLLPAIDAAIARLAELEALSAGLAAQIETAAQRRRRFTAQFDRIRNAVEDAMETAGICKREAPAGTVYHRSTQPRAVVTDVSLLPEEYLRRKPPEPMLIPIAAALKDGHDVPGAQLSNGGKTIAIKFT